MPSPKPRAEPTETDIALFQLRRAVKEGHAEKLYPEQAKVALQALELHAELVEALEKIARKATLKGDVHDSIQEVVGRFQNIGKVANEALRRAKGDSK